MGNYVPVVFNDERGQGGRASANDDDDTDHQRARSVGRVSGKRKR